MSLDSLLSVGKGRGLSLSEDKDGGKKEGGWDGEETKEEFTIRM